MREYQGGSADASGNATFGPGLVFEGKLSFQGQVRFDGTFTGEITTDDLLIIGETAKVSRSEGTRLNSSHSLTSRMPSSA